MDLSIFSLKGKTAIVTGASRGIGKACALALADGGADLVLASRSLEDLKKTAKEVEAKGSKALPLTVDILKEDHIDTMVQETIAHFGKIDILVNNAGVGKTALVEDIKTADWDWVLDHACPK